MRNLVLSAALIFSSAISANAQQTAPGGSSVGIPQGSYFDKLKTREKAWKAKLQAAREARQANPLAWAKSLNPLPRGGWKLIYVASDGSEATFVSSDQEVREGKYVTIWMRYEFGDNQYAQSGGHLSSVEKDQYDCASARVRLLSVSRFPENNLKGTAETYEQSRSTAPWTAIIPGSGEEDIWRYVCGKK
ncbi:MAG: surface-adhesin E family protein [Gammaproteobacteria bacterium]